MDQPKDNLQVKRSAGYSSKIRHDFPTGFRTTWDFQKIESSFVYLPFSFIFITRVYRR
jgi:hypothetical protein